MMPELIAYCGLDCAECKALKATQSKDAKMKEQLAKQWSEGLQDEFIPEDINCDGCKSSRISGWCRRICKIRPCAGRKMVKTCAHCDEYICQKLQEFLSKEPVATKNLTEIRRTLQV